MATNLEVISDALGLLSVLGEGDTATAEQGEHGLRVLNDLMAEWTADGIDVGHFPQSDVSEDFPASYTVLLAVKYGLALALAPHYQKPVDVAVGALAGKYYLRLLRDAVKSKMVESDMTHLPVSEGGSGQYNIETDSM